MALANVVKFTPASSGTGDFVYSSTAVGFRTPVGNLTDGSTYSYRAESADLSEWEIGTGAWTSASSTLARTTVVASSTGSKVSFTAAPSVGIVALAADILQPGNNLSDVGSASSARTNLRVREMLLAARTYYVRTDGSDSNDGLTDSAGGAFLTIGKAMTVVAALDLGGTTVTVQVGAGTYAEAVTLALLIGGAGTLIGDTTTPSNVVISATSANAIRAITGNRGWTVRGFKLTTTTSGYSLYANNGSSVVYNSIDFGASAGGHIFANNGSFAFCTGNYTISGSAPWHWAVDNGSILTSNSDTITLSGTPAFSTAFAYAARNGVMKVDGNTFSGSATGKRYQAENGGAISTNGAGTSYLPGNSAGTGTNAGASPYGLYN